MIGVAVVDTREDVLAAGATVVVDAPGDITEALIERALVQFWAKE